MDILPIHLFILNLKYLWVDDAVISKKMHKETSSNTTKRYNTKVVGVDGSIK